MYQDTHALDCDQCRTEVMAIIIPTHCRSILDLKVKEVGYHRVFPQSWGKRTFWNTHVEISAAGVKSLLVCFLTNVATIKHTVSGIRGVTGNSAPCNSYVLQSSHSCSFAWLRRVFAWKDRISWLSYRFAPATIWLYKTHIWSCAYRQEMNDKREKTRETIFDFLFC